MKQEKHATLQTEVEFELPKGFLDDAGVLHKQGVMRLATAADEILPLRDPRVVQNPAYFTIIVLSRVIVRLGGVPDISPKVIEGLFASDLAFLQRLYEGLNGLEETDSGTRNQVSNTKGMTLANGGLGSLGEG
ncbi:MAG TPA: hypothetical protein DCL48_11225 [Alphaproteobacteria bacterium]|nr:hypothetical protein [Alphaproteobacteria bacterium]